MEQILDYDYTFTITGNVDDDDHLREDNYGTLHVVPAAIAFIGPYEGTEANSFIATDVGKPGEPLYKKWFGSMPVEELKTRIKELKAQVLNAEVS